MTANATKAVRYVLISPCRDEAQYMGRTIESIAGQTVPPALWVIVDDGSTDDTPQVLRDAASRLPYIRIVTRQDRGKRAVGPGVIDAFYAGYATINPMEYDYICKLDLDLEIPSAYFETMIRRMLANRRLGTCSGKPYFVAPDGSFASEGCGDETSVGMIKFYRTECFREIQGFVREVMWDGIDCHRCRMLGWIATSWDEPEIRFVHLRPMGSSQRGILTGRLRHGFGQYFMGTAMPYMAASAVYRFAHRPFLVGGLAMFAGYFLSMIRREPRYSDLKFRRFLRRYQYACLLQGKKRATLAFDERQASVFERRNRTPLPSCRQAQ